jgi:hypothetical protein
MSLETIIDLGGVLGISHASINVCAGVWLRVCEENNRAMLYRCEEDFDFATALIITNNENKNGVLSIFVELVPHFGDKVKEKLFENEQYIQIASEDKALIEELYISNQKLKLGYIEPKRGYLHLTDRDDFLIFVVLNYETLTRERIRDLKNTHPDLHIYVRNVATIDQVKHCQACGVHGIVTHNGKMAKKHPLPGTM